MDINYQKLLFSLENIKLLNEFKDFEIIKNDNVAFFIYKNNFNEFRNNIDNYRNIFNKYSIFNNNNFNILKSIFIFIYNPTNAIEIYDKFNFIFTSVNPDKYLKKYILKIKNLEGLRIIATDLKIKQIFDKRKYTELQKLPYTEINDINQKYFIYNNEYNNEYESGLNDKLDKMENNLLLENKRIYFIYFKKNINYIEYFEKEKLHIIIFYPEFLKEEILDFLKNTLKEKK